ncbi:MAG: hypothetical protein K6F29_04970 [Bacteroidales bacterium]|jgi:hypothetical protein|nr:hypothetical protein [Bacteroidales bacterium]
MKKAISLVVFVVVGVFIVHSCSVKSSVKNDPTLTQLIQSVKQLSDTMPNMHIYVTDNIDSAYVWTVNEKANDRFVFSSTKDGITTCKSVPNSQINMPSEADLATMVQKNSKSKTDKKFDIEVTDKGKIIRK